MADSEVSQSVFNANPYSREREQTAYLYPTSFVRERCLDGRTDPIGAENEGRDFSNTDFSSKKSPPRAKTGDDDAGEKRRRRRREGEKSASGKVTHHAAAGRGTPHGVHPSADLGGLPQVEVE